MSQGAAYQSLAAITLDRKALGKAIISSISVIGTSVLSLTITYLMQAYGALTIFADDILQLRWQDSRQRFFRISITQGYRPGVKHGGFKCYSAYLSCQPNALMNIKLHCAVFAHLH
jgi:hypothetical protein